MILEILLLIVGFVILIKGADYFVDGASSVATNMKLSKMLIGLTIVSFGTSAPEFAVSVTSLLSGNGDIVLGNVIGSNILNILLILGVSSLFHFLNVKNNTVKKEIPITILITCAFAILISDNLFNSKVSNAFTRADGIVILLFFLVFVYYLINMMRNKVEDESESKMKLSKAIFLTLFGIVAIIFGSNLVVNNATSIAESLGVSEKLISLTIIALGTSLPELVTSVSATRKGEYDIAIGNVVGSNIFNIGIVLGIPVAILGDVAAVSFNYIDLIVMVLAAILLYVFTRKEFKLTKVHGILFLLIFAVYYSYVILNGIM